MPSAISAASVNLHSPGAVGDVTPSTGAFTDLTASTSFRIGGNVTLLGIAANTLALRNGANAQTLVLYKGYTDGSNHSEFSVDVTSTIVAFKRTQAGTGTTITQFDFDGPLVVNGSSTYLQLHDQSRPSTDQSGWRLWADSWNLNFQVFDTGSSQSGLELFSHSGTTYLRCKFDNDCALGDPSFRWKSIYCAGTVKGTLTTLTNATTGLAAGILAATTNATINITDGTGQVYRVPCII